MACTFVSFSNFLNVSYFRVMCSLPGPGDDPYFEEARDERAAPHEDGAGRLTGGEAGDSYSRSSPAWLTGVR